MVAHETPPPKPAADAPDWLRCTACGYRLHGLCSEESPSVVCPECGTPADYHKLYRLHCNPPASAWRITGYVVGTGLVTGVCVSVAWWIGAISLAAGGGADPAVVFAVLLGPWALALPVLVVVALRIAGLPTRRRPDRRALGRGEAVWTVVYVIGMLAVAVAAPFMCCAGMIFLLSVG